MQRYTFLLMAALLGLTEAAGKNRNRKVRKSEIRAFSNLIVFRSSHLVLYPLFDLPAA